LGHLHLLEECAKLGKVTVGLNTDEFIERYKGQKPTMKYHEREAMLWAQEYVSDVLENTGCEDIKPLVEKVNPNYIVVGSDWLSKDYLKQTGLTTEYLEAMEISLVFVPRYYRMSSSMIKERIKNA
jgi:glycerol-3-phosphate cytidylyltransferase